ncbi:hypothetical protein HRbin36_02015 [bacterium HR36]|nr:hypothetical protein HRbin36_02015 [bacterium HR36]
MAKRCAVMVGWLVLAGCPPLVRAELIELVLQQREPFAQGQSFGDTGPYVKLTGVARFALDPNHLANQPIVDLSLAPRNAQGKVEFAADVCILAPADLRKGNGTILYDVNNRGNKLALRFFNDARGTNDPATATDAGNGFLMRRGYTIVWSGWIGELLPGENRLLLAPPPVLENGRPVRGVARFEMSTDAPAEWLPLSRRPGHGSYRPTPEGLQKALLTWRMRESDPRVIIPRDQWRVEIRTPKPPERGVPGTLAEVRLYVAGGFRPGYLYELVTEVEGAFVQGVGFAGVRDLVSFLRYDKSEHNPLAVQGQPAISRAYAFGVSQSGRFLRHFLYLGFNADEQGRRVFDAVWPHVAGGGLGFFNHRFAQPTRHNGQHEDHAYPADMFPFTYGDSYDPFQQREDGILRRLTRTHPDCVPKIFHTQTAAEYWHRSGSLVHTDPLGRSDAQIPENVRIYAFAGTQHGPGPGTLPAPGKPAPTATDLPPNPADYRPLLRALLDALDDWVKQGKEPPASVYPTIASGTLVLPDRQHTGFPALPGVRYPEVIQRPQVFDYGPEFAPRGIITQEPPKAVASYTVLVAKCDEDGNELGMLRLPDIAVPLATYTGWNLRHRSVGAEGMLANLLGACIPFPRTAEERQKRGDPRQAIKERYRDFADYCQRYRQACDELVRQRLLLPEDRERLIRQLAERQIWFAP